MYGLDLLMTSGSTRSKKLFVAPEGRTFCLWGGYDSDEPNSPISLYTLHVSVYDTNHHMYSFN